MLRGAQAALFDVSDLTQPRRTDVVRYRSASVAAAAADPRQFTWLPDSETALTVISEGWEGRTGWVSVLSVDGGMSRTGWWRSSTGTMSTRCGWCPCPTAGWCS